MRPLLFILLVVLVLLTVWLVAEAVEVDDDELHGWGYVTRDFVIERPPTTTTVVPRARTAPTVRSRSVGAPVRVHPPGTINGYPCGNDLPPCWVLARESGGNPTAQNPRSTASGLWQFLRSTWAGYGGYVNAKDAPWEVQNERARQVWAGGAGCRHWSACG